MVRFNFSRVLALVAVVLVQSAHAVKWSEIGNGAWIHPDNYRLIEDIPTPITKQSVSYNGDPEESPDVNNKSIYGNIIINLESGSEQTLVAYKKSNDGVVLIEYTYENVSSDSYESALAEIEQFGAKQRSEWGAPAQSSEQEPQQGSGSEGGSNQGSTTEHVDDAELQALKEQAEGSQHYAQYATTNRDEDLISHEVDFGNLPTESSNIHSAISMGQQQTIKDEGDRDALIADIAKTIESLESCANGQKTDGLNEGINIYDTINDLRKQMDELWDSNLSLEYKNVILADSLDKLNEELALCTTSAEVNLVEVNEAVKKSEFGNFDEFLNASMTEVITYPLLERFSSLEALNSAYMSREGRIYVGLYIKNRQFYYQSIEHK